MTKYMVTVIVGVFLGAFALEVMGRKSPALLRKARRRARDAADEFRRSFIDGYDSVIRESKASRTRSVREAGGTWEASSSYSP